MNVRPEPQLTADKIQALTALSRRQVERACALAYTEARRSLLENPPNDSASMEIEHLLDTITYLFEVHLNAAAHHQGISDRHGYLDALKAWYCYDQNPEGMLSPSSNTHDKLEKESNTYRRALQNENGR